MSETTQEQTQNQPQELFGQQLVNEINEQVEEINKDLVKFFDKEQKAPARRVRNSLSVLSKKFKEIRKLVQETKNERYPKDSQGE